MRRVLLSAVMLFAVLVPFASAQTNCPAAPVIVQTYGTNPMCAGAYASFDAGPGWTTYAWSNGSHDRTWAENPMASESLTVTVTDANGCQLTSQPFQVTVLDTPPNRTIHVTPDDPTPGAAVHAWVDAAGSTNAFQWQVYNGTPTGSIDGTSVDFTAGQSGGIGLYVTETAPNGCTGGGMTSVQINTAEPVTIATSTTAMCTGAHATASVSGWESASWTITNGSFVTNSYPYTSTTANGPSVEFSASGAGDVRLVVDTFNMNGMRSGHGSATVNLLTIPAPTIEVSSPALCPNGVYAQASVANSGNYGSFEWSVVNGNISQGSYGSNGPTIYFNANGTQPVQVSVTVTDYNGCRATQTVTVPIRTIDAPTINVSSPALCPNGVYAEASVPNASDYSWYEWTVVNGNISQGTFGSNGPTIYFNASGNDPVQVNLTVTDYNGCRASQSVTVPIRTIQAPTINVSSPALCPNGVYAEATVPNPTDYSWYEWTVVNGNISNPGYGSSNGPSIYFNASGNDPVQVNLTVTDYNGCRASQSVTVPIRTIQAPTINVSSPALCPNGVYAEATVPNPTDYSWYEWTVVNGNISNPGYGASGPSIYFNASGNDPVQVNLTVTDYNGCRASQSVTVPIRTIQAPTINVSSPALCPNGVYAEATVPNPTDYSWYEWTVVNGNISNPGYGASGPSIYFNASGNDPVQVNLTVTDYNGCRASQSVTVPIRTLAAPTIDLSSAAVCAMGASTQASVANPTNYASYNWSITNGRLAGGSPSSSSVSFLANGADPVQLSVTVVDFNGCTATQSVTVPVAAAPDATINVGPYNQYNLTTGSQAVMAGSISSGGTYDYCGSADLRLTAPLAIGNSYQWSTGSSSPSIHVTESGTYSVTVTNAGGCMSSDSVTIAIHPIPAAPTITSSRPSLCPNGSVTLTASDADGWLWSTGAQTRSIVVTSSGQYTVRAIVAGCQSAPSAPLTLDLDTVSINASATGFCPGGSATLTATAGASYHWSNNATTQSIVVTTAGTYSVTVTSADGCSITSAPVTITTSSLAVSVTPSNAVTTCSDAPATLTASATGGAGGYSYQWFNAAGPIAGGTGASFAATAIGTDLYHVVVTDSAGCTVGSAATSVTNNAAPAGTLSTYSSLCPNQVYYAQVYGTAPQSTLDWSVTNGTIVSTSGYLTYRAGASGSVVVTVTEHLNGCSKTSSVTVPIRVAPNATVTANGPTTFCAGGSVTLTAPVNAQYSWSNGASTQSITVTAPGDYWVTVRSDEGCPTTSAPVTVNVTPLPDATITASGSTSLCPGSSITLSAPAGVASNWYRDGTQISNQSSITTSTAATYELRTSANGCTNSSTITVTVDHSLEASMSGTGIVCWQNESGWYQYNGTASSYSWTVTNATITGGQGTNRITFTPNAGASTMHVALVVGSAAGCSMTLESDSTVNKPIASITASGPTTFCAGGSVTLTASGSNLTYLWSNGQTGPSITVTQTGNYSVHAINNPNGCDGPESAPVAVTVKARPTAVVSGSSSGCPSTSRTIQATLTGTAPFSVTWSDGVVQSGINATSVSRTVSPASTTTYTITAVSDAGGCSGTSSGSAVVTVAAAPSITQQPTNLTTTRNTTVTFHVVASPAGVHYQWQTLSGSTWSAASGATATTADYQTSQSKRGTFSYRVIVSDDCSRSVTSNVVTLTVN